MPRERNQQEGMSDRFKEAIDVVSACGEPAAHFKATSSEEWGDLDDDHHRPKQEDVSCSSFEEVVDFYDQTRPADITLRRNDA